MNVGFCLFRWLNLDDEVDIRNVNASRGNVSGDKDTELVFSEALQSNFSLILSNVTMHHLNVGLYLV